MSPTKAALRLAVRGGVVEPDGEAAYDVLYTAVSGGETPDLERLVRRADKGVFARMWEKQGGTA